MNITNEQPPLNTYPKDFTWVCNGISHNLEGLCLDNAKMYQNLVEDNKENLVLGLIQATDARNTMLRNVAQQWECDEMSASKIIEAYLMWAKEENYNIREACASSLKGLCKKTKLGEGLANILMLMHLPDSDWVL